MLDPVIKHRDMWENYNSLLTSFVSSSSML